MEFVVIAEHPPNLCPHSSAKAREQMERTPGLRELAKQLGIEVVFVGIPVPEHQTFMVLRAPNFESVRRLMVESGFVQTNTVRIRQTETVEEYRNEIKSTTPIF
jgi:uncharacterized protein with GYD domain